MRPVLRLGRLLAEKFLLTSSALLAIAALGSGRVAIHEVPALLDVRLLMLFAVLAIAVELGRASRLFDDAVIRVARRVRTARGLAVALTSVTGILAMFLTNDVALFLIIPFTLLFTRVAKIDLAPIVVLEISSANVVGALTPIGNPQNLFLYGRGGFSPLSFVEAQLPIVGFGAVLLAAAAWRLTPRGAFTAPAAAVPPVDRLRAAAFAVLLGAEAASIVGAIPPAIPLAMAAAGAVLLGPRLREADFTLVFVLALLFVGVAGLERAGFSALVDPRRMFGGGAPGLLVSGSLMSQIVSNVPAAMLLAPAAAAAGAPGFHALLRAVTVGACGTPWASIANLIGAQLYLQSGAPAGRFWKLFTAVSGLLLILLLAFALGWTRLTAS